LRKARNDSDLRRRDRRDGARLTDGVTTGIRWIGTKRYTLTLAPGNHAHGCSAHYRTMNGTFVVTAP